MEGKVSYDYDSLDRVIGVKIDNADTPQFEYRYEASGNLAIVKDNLRNITTYSGIRFGQSPVENYG
jgi:hypothetical protein